MSNDIETNFVAKVDESSFKQAGSILDRVIKKQQEFNTAAAQAAEIESRKSGRVEAGASGRSGIESELRSIIAASDNAAANVGNMSSELTILGGALSTVGGEAGQTANELLQVSSRLSAAAKVAPDLVASVQSMPAAMTASIAGVTGLTISATALAAATIAFAAVGIAAVAALDGMKKSGEEEVRQLELQRKAQIAYADALQLTTVEIDDLIEANERLVQQNEDQIAREQEVINERGQAATGAEAGLRLFTDTIGITGQAASSASDEIGRLTEQSEAATAENERYAESLNSVEVAANDARAALFEQLDQETALREFERDALRSTEEQNAARAQGIADRQSDIENEIAQWEASGDTSEEAQERLAELNSELDTLGKQSEILGSQAVKAAEAEKAQAAAAEDVAKAAEQAAAAEKQLAQERQAAAQAVADAQAKQSAAFNDFILAGAESGSELEKQAIEQSNKLLDVQEKAHKAEEKAQRDFNKKKDQLAKNQSFLALFDLQDNAGDEATERAQERADKLADLRAGFEEERTELKAQEEATQADKFAQIQRESKAVADAKSKENQILKRGRDEAVAIQRNRLEQERQLYQQSGQAVQQWSQQVQKAVREMFSSLPAGAGGVASVEDQINAALLETIS